VAGRDASPHGWKDGRSRRYLLPTSGAFPDHLALGCESFGQHAAPDSERTGLLFRKTAGRYPGDFSGYRPGRASRRMPVVWSQRECQSLFAEMSGTNRLMTRLIYGAGLRLEERSTSGF